MKELVGHVVAYRKLVSASPSELLPEDVFRLYAVCARFPDHLSAKVPWHQRQAGVYDCQWGTDQVRVIVAGQLPCEVQNAPLHLFSTSPELLSFGRSAYKQRSEGTSHVLGQLFENLQGEGLAMSYTMEDFKRDLNIKYFNKLSPNEQQEVIREWLKKAPLEERLAGLSPEERLASLSPEQIREYLDRLPAGRSTSPRKLRRRK